MWLLYHVMAVAALAKFGQTAYTSDSTYSPEYVEARIAGGSNTKINFFPFMAQVVISKGSRPSAYCGGTVVSRRHVLTSARCIFNRNFQQYDPSKVKVILGTTHKNEGGSEFNVEAIHDYRAFNLNTTEQTDVAILALSRPIIYSDTIRPVRLAYESDMEFVMDLIEHQETCIVLGYGKTQIGSSPRISSSGDLKVSLVQLRTLTECHSSLPATKSNVLCAVSVDGSTICNGDAGGPLICDNMQLGVVSKNMGDECMHANAPTWFARIDTAYNTISEMMDQTPGSET